ncbi:MAG: hypothetical protein FWE74_09100 [Oscillospiraceae bacterium]|nr:hypothetical protein [Oscillospiraceae bacterium]
MIIPLPTGDTMLYFGGAISILFGLFAMFSILLKKQGDSDENTAAANAPKKPGKAAGVFAGLFFTALGIGLIALNYFAG